jgi:hypothetical protein
MSATDTARQVTTTVEESAGKATDTAAGKAKQSAGKAAETAAKAASSAKSATAKAASKVKGSTAKAVAGARASRAAKSGLVEKARAIAPDGAAVEAIAEVDAMHYQVEVNKRGLSVTALTKTLNERWENGWRLAHMLEQRGNTVLVFEKRG